MENAAEALKMAAAVLIFVIALSISINAFGQARRTVQTVLEYKDREYNYTYVKDSENSTRVVSAETIIPAVYKAYKENYKIIFKFKNGPEWLYIKNKNDGISKEYITSIDLERDVNGGTDSAKDKYFNVLIYGPKRILGNDSSSQSWKDFENIYKIDLGDLQSHPIYDRIKNEKTFKEQIGVYYQEEVYGAYSPDANVPDANKNKKRVITYTAEDVT